ncbi:MAG: 3-phosphoshikimate 1-carboxyvinyltransferase, partial [Pseudomonadota bacterium]
MPLRAQPVRRLSGTVHVPGDKSISHRSLILGALTVGETRITGLLEGEDVQNTAKVMRALGADVLRHDDGVWSVHGTGIGTLLQPEETLDFGNSGTGARLVLGMVAGHGITAVFDGDASLRKRPMGRVLAPLEQIGARVVESRDGKMPLTLKGALDPLPITYELPVPSAQVKSAVLLAGLNAPGETTVIEPVVTRDHTERMLAHFGAMLDIEGRPEGGRRITLHGRPELTPSDIAVPADPSSAAFPLVAAILAQDGEVRLNGVMINATRSGLLTTLTEMVDDITLEFKRDLGGDPVADLV